MTDIATIRPPIPQWRGLPGSRKLLGVLLLALLLAVTLSILQDFLQSMRRGGAFYFSESLLFKSVWFFFLPMLMMIGHVLRSRRIDTIAAKARIVILATLLHVMLVPPTVWLISSLFRDTPYGMVKMFTYTVSNDLLAIILIYASFVFLVTRRDRSAAAGNTTSNEPAPGFLVIKSGRKTHRIALGDILHVQSATPYVAIQLGQRQLLHQSSLAAIGEQLGPRFIRVHRTTRVNIDKVVSCTSRLNGDYDLTLVDGSQVRLSRNYAAAFKAHFEQSPQLKP